MADIFISYSTYDQVRTTEIRDLLEQNGFSCWMGNRDIPGGSNFTVAITKAIDECKMFVLILTESAQNSPYVFKELDYAISKRAYILPIILENCELKREFRYLLAGVNGIHAYNKEITQSELLLRIKEFSCLNSATTQSIVNTKVSDSQIKCPVCQSTRISCCLSKFEIWGLNLQYLFRLLPMPLKILIVLLTIVAVIIFISFSTYYLYADTFSRVLPTSIEVFTVQELALVMTIGTIIAHPLLVLLIMYSYYRNRRFRKYIKQVVKTQNRSPENKNHEKIPIVSHYRCYNCNKRFSVKNPNEKFS